MLVHRLIVNNSSKCVKQLLIRSVSFSSSSSLNSTKNEPINQNPKEKWDLHAGVLVERLPIISKTLKPIEKEFQQLLWQIEFENSLKSDFELRHEYEQKQAELLKKGEIEIDLDDTIAKQTAQDLKDAYVDESKKFKFASRITEDDKKNNLKSINRKLENNLYLIIEQKLGEKNHLMLPQGIRNEGETMRQTAERVLQEKCGNNLQVLFNGNAPCGFYKYKYPSTIRKESVGVKVFFYRAAYKNGNVDEKLTKNFEWLTSDDIPKKINKSLYVESIQKFLLE